MSLLQNMSYAEQKKALTFTLEQCEIIAKLANLKISFNDSNRKPGEILLKNLDRRGFKIQYYRQLLDLSQNIKTIATYYKPTSKIAILIANDKYLYLSKLVTPSIDCDSLGSSLKNLGFLVVIIKNMKSDELKAALSRVLDVVPENSYCFIFYAGHGCELCNTKCMLNIDCPTEDIRMEHCVTENFVLKELAKCKPELCVLVMDMCRIHLDRTTNPQIYSEIPNIDEYTIHRNLIIAYSTQSAQSAYEVLHIECSTTITDETIEYELKTGDTDKIVPGASQYVNALCTRLTDDLDVNTMFDKVHADVESSKKQMPIKVQCGSEKRSLYDQTTGDIPTLLNQLKEIIKDFKDNCIVF